MENMRALSRPLHDRSKQPTLHSISAHSTYGVPKSLNLNRKIFLSHSGKDKDFVCFLQKELCNRYHDAVAFFDLETLPRGEPVSMDNILEEARGSKLGVLVLTEEFFVHTPNPMLELEAFVDNEVKLLPLFYKMSVDGFKEASRRARWEEQWRKWSVVDEAVINKWRCALDVVKTFCGLEYYKIGAGNPSEYIHKIVDAVTRIVPPTIPFSEEGSEVCGKDRLCKIVDDMYKESTSKHSSNDCTQVVCASVREDSGYTFNVVGIYGFAGLGKTTLCKCLCDFYFTELNGKVCHVDLGSIPFDHHASCQMHSSKPSFMRMRYMLSMLGGYNNDIDGHYSLQLSQVENLLRRHISSLRDPIFLAIDNILPEMESQEEADFYLRCEFPKGSKIFITSRSQSILENILSLHSSRLSVAINYMPMLQFEEAREIFVHALPKFEISDIEKTVNDLVNMCTIRIKKQLKHHPLMIKSLAAYIRWDRMSYSNLDWKGRLTNLQIEGINNNNNPWKKIFSVLDLGYAILSEEAKLLFLDLALLRGACKYYHVDEWIESVHSHLNKKKIQEIVLQLQDLSFIEEKLHDLLQGLMVDFAKYKAWMNGNYLVVEEDSRDCWPSDQYRPTGAYRYIRISGCRYGVTTLDLRDVEGVEVLHLLDNAGLQEVLLSRTTCHRLRSLIVRAPPRTSLRCITDESWSTSTPAAAGSQLGQHRAVNAGTRAGPLTWVQLEGNVIFTIQREESRSWLSHSNYVLPQSLLSFLRRLEILAAPALDLARSVGDLRYLQLLTLSGLPSVQAMDLTSCTTLKTLELLQLPSLRFIRGLDRSANLQHLDIQNCEQLRLIHGIDNSTYLKYLNVANCEQLRSIRGLDKPTNLEYLNIANCKQLSVIDGVLNNLTNATNLCIERCDKLLALTIPADSFSRIRFCRSLKTISLSADHTGSVAGCSTRTRRLEILFCPTLRHIHGLPQYTGYMSADGQSYTEGFTEQGYCLEETFRDLLESAEIDSCSSIKARVKKFELYAYGNQLAGRLTGAVRAIEFVDAQHIGLLVSAVFKAQTAYLEELSIRCKRDGDEDCGCDKNAPHFGPLPKPSKRGYNFCPRLKYCCPLVTDLASVAQWHLLVRLDLSGCTSVEVWPDFATMTSLQHLDLSYTSLKEWPAGVLLLCDLNYLNLRGCGQLPAEEFIKVITQIQQPTQWHSLAGTLIDDLEGGRRDTCSIVDALDSYYPELVALFHRSRHFITNLPCSTEILFLIKLMYDLWFGEVDAWSQASTDHLSERSPPTLSKMGRLLCSEIFMSLPFHLLSTLPNGRMRLDNINWYLEQCYITFVLMAYALVGVGSIGCYNASGNEDLKDRIITFVKWFGQENYDRVLEKIICYPKMLWIPERHWVTLLEVSPSPVEVGLLKVRVEDAVCKMARVPSVADGLGEGFVHTIIDSLEAELVYALE